jgi:hypothetical protein
MVELLNMSGYIVVLFVFCIEIAIFLVEVVLSALNRKNRLMAKANIIDEFDFIDLEKGYHTSLSVFRVSMFLAYIILVILLIDKSTAENQLEELILYIIIGVLIYMISLMNLKVFNFYSNYFVIGSPFHFFNKDLIIKYEDIEDFILYRALYNSYYLRLKFRNSPDKLIQFSASYLPRNDFIIRIILNSKTNQSKDFQTADEEDDIGLE